MSEDHAFVASFLKEHDRDRYYGTLVIPAAGRADVQALYAFGAEIAAIPARVSEPAPGEIRLQWWHDALSGTEHGEVRQNPIAAALLDVLERNALPAGPLLRLIAARRFDLYHDPMPDMDSFDGYAGETVSSLYHYAASVLNGGVEIESGDAAGHLGVAHALIGHLQAFGFNASQGRIYLPLPYFLANGVSEEQILQGRNSDGLQRALGQLRDIAAAHLEKSETAVSALPRRVRPVFALAGLLRAELKAMRPEADPFRTAIALADWRKIMAVSLWSLRNA